MQNLIIKYSFSIKSFNINLLKNITNKSIINKFNFFGKTNTIYLPKKLKKFTVLKSPHINKTAREQFEIRTNKNLIKLFFTSPSKLNFNLFLLSFCKKIPSGISVRIEKVEQYFE